MNERKEDDNGIGAQAKLKKFVKDHCGYILSFILTVFIHAFKEHASSKISPYIHFLSMEVLVKLALGLGIVSSLLLLLIFCSEVSYLKRIKTRLFGTEKHDLEEAVKAIDIEEYFRSIYCKKSLTKLISGCCHSASPSGNQSQLSAECFEAYFAAIELLNTRREQNAEKATSSDMCLISLLTRICRSTSATRKKSRASDSWKQVKDLSERLTIPHDYPSTTTVEEAQYVSGFICNFALFNDLFQGQANESVSDDYSGE
uniref:Uncharacterized protein n=1 Tax=Ditylenchus dipsaci TaxID=166011 RepID=A0A915E0X6_9BILA